MNELLNNMNLIDIFFYGIKCNQTLDYPTKLREIKINFIFRHAEATIKRLVNSYPAVLVTGARQTGKTTLLKKVTDSADIPYLTFDDPMEEASAKNDPKTFSG